MDEYITRNNAISAICFGCNQQFSNDPCEPSECTIRQSILALPTADVVEVVRCENCKFYCFNRGATYCTHKAGLVSTWQSNYCGYGERKGKNDE